MAYKEVFLASQEGLWLMMQEPMQRNDPGSQINVWKVSILNSSLLKARLPRLCQVGLMSMASPAPWENLEDQEMVGKRMWVVETTSHETELTNFHRCCSSARLQAVTRHFRCFFSPSCFILVNCSEDANSKQMSSMQLLFWVAQSMPHCSSAKECSTKYVLNMFRSFIRL